MANGNSPVIFNKTDSLAVGSADIIILIARILLGWLFLKAGWDKLMNPAGFTSYLAALGLPAFFTWPGLIAELVIGVGLILGVATRYAALFSAVYLVITIWCAHRYWTYPPTPAGCSVRALPQESRAHRRLPGDLRHWGGQIFRRR